MVLNRWYEHDEVQFETKLSQKNSFIEKYTGWDKLRSRLTLSIVSVSPTAAVLHPNLPQPHQLHEHQGGRATVTGLPLLSSVPLQWGTHHPLIWGETGALLKALEIGEGNIYFIYCLTWCFDFQIVWVLLLKKFRQTHGVLPHSPWVRTKMCLWMPQILDLGLFPGGSGVENLPAMWKTQVQSLGWEDPLEKEMATLSSILAWEIPWTEEPGGLQSMRLQRVGHDWTTEHSTAHGLRQDVTEKPEWTFFLPIQYLF